MSLLSECFNSPYGTQYFKEYAERVPDGASCEALKNAAIKNKVGLSALFNFIVVHVLVLKVYLIGGSIPEVSDGSFYNTSTVWCPQGQLLATHRKIHLFDIGL